MEASFKAPQKDLLPEAPEKPEEGNDGVSIGLGYRG